MGWRLLRDDYGIPHVQADSVRELGFGQGHTAARDRAWQLDFQRLRAEGRVAAALGMPGVEWDVFSRRVGIDTTARAAYTKLRPETRELVEAFVDGVNAGLAPAPEHEALGLTPGRWQPWTPLGVFLAQHVLFATFPSKLWRHRVRRHLGDRGLELFRHDGWALSGSNAFAVGGGRTASGLPLIAGDPHRIFEAPNVYAQVHLACPEFDVVGFTFPGVPGVQHFGHTGSVAWAITNAMADYQDLYVETVDEIELTWDTVEVRDSDPVAVALMRSARGPVLIGEPGGEELLSLRTPSLDDAELGFDAILPLLRSRTAAEVDEAFELWVEPVNNVVIADTTGDVRHRVAGRVPDHPLRNRELPVPAADDWTGYVAALPRTDVKPDDVVVTANDRVNDDYDRIGSEFALPYRAARIRELLGDRAGLQVEDLAAILTDTYSARAGRFLDQDGGVYLAARDALVAELAADDELAPLRGGSPYGHLYDTWFHLPSYLAKALRPGDTRGFEARKLPPQPARRFHPVHGLEQLGLESSLVRHLHEATSVPVYGDSDCVQAMHAVPGVPVCSRGPVARYVWDLADRDNSRWVVPLGASGPAGPHSADQLPLWAGGRLVPVVTDWDRLTAE